MDAQFYEATGYNSAFDYKGETFDGYVAHERHKIAKARKAAGADDSTKVVNGNSSYELKPTKYIRGKNKRYKKAVIIMHGLAESTYEVSEISEFYQNRGFLVRALLLPGHGSVAGDLLNVKLADWEKAVDFAVTSTLQEADELHLAGSSTGGGLAILQAYKRPEIKSLMLFSPLVKINSKVDFMSPFLKRLGDTIKPLRWLYKTEETCLYRYMSLTMNALNEAYQLTEKLKKYGKQKTLDIPILIFITNEDDIVSPQRTMEFFVSQHNPKSKIILYSTQNIEPQDDRIKLISTADTNSKIKSFAHEAFLYKPSNPVFGINGTQKHCFGYLQDTESYKKCMDPNYTDVIFGGGKLQSVLSKQIARRLTFNPRYDEMLKEISIFLKSIKA